jgi:WD40 repeat protein
MTYDVFTSYSRRDAAQATLLATRLTHEAGLRVWMDLARLQPGSSWRADIETAMNDSAAVLIIWGSSGLGPVQRQERDLAYAIRDAHPDFRVMYVLLPGTTPPQGTWANVDTWVHFKSSLDEPDVFAQVVAALKGEAPPTHLVAELPEAPTPYRGLAAFGLEDTRFFFGRTAYVEEMLERLPQYPFLAVLGPSGSGKTSLVQAGFLARLQAQITPGRSTWPWLLVRPGPHPLRALATSLSRLQPRENPVGASDALLQRIQANPEQLPEIMQIFLQPQERLVLVIDRLEELFTLCQAEEERRSFIEALLAPIQHPHRPAWVIATMRADFYGHVGRYADLAGQVVNHQVYVKPMTTEAVAEVIEAPAAQVGAIFEKGLATQVVADAQVRNEVALPLLEHTLDLLWRKRRGRWLTWDAYQEIGGVAGALRYHADRVIEELSPRERDVARRLFMRLVWLDESAGTMAGRRVQKGVLVAQASDPGMEERVLQQLADERLIVVRGEWEGATVELVHDTLPLHWTLLQQWVQEDRAFVLWRQRLLVTVAEWEHAGHDQDILFRGARLAEAERWLVERSDDLTPAAQTFIQASQEEAKDELARQREEAERYRVLFEEAERQRRNALARQLAAQAELMRTSRADLLPCSVLLAVEAMRRAPSLEADQTLRRGLALLPRPLARLEHEESVQKIALSPDGRYLATASRDHMVRLWNAVSGREVTRLAHQTIITATDIDIGLAFSPDGRLLATASGDDSARVWQVPGGCEVARMTHGDFVWAVAFSPDGRYVATASQDCTARVWEIPSGREVARMTHEHKLEALAFGPDGTSLATASDGVARVWEVPSGHEIIRTMHEDLVRAVAFSPDGRYVATASQDRTARVWEVPSGREIIRTMHEDLVRAVAFSPDGRYVATASQDRTARVWEVPSGREVSRMIHEREIVAVSFGADSISLATASDRIARVWEVPSGREVSRMVHEDLVWEVAFSPDGTFLTTASADHTARMWEPCGYREVARMTHAGKVSALAFSPNGIHLATASVDLLSPRASMVQLWDATNGCEVMRLPHEGRIFAVAYSPEGIYLGTAGADHTARVWDTASGQELARLCHGDLVWAVSFSPDGTYLATASLDSSAHLWQVSSGREVTRLPHGRNVVALRFSADGRYLATASSDHTARVWDTASGQELARLCHGDLVWAVSFSPDGTYLATASLDGFARLWQVSSGREVTRLPHGRNVVAVSFSANGRYLATASSDHTARVWDTTSGRELARLSHEGGVKSVVFSADDRYVTTASTDYTARVWEVSNGLEMARMTHERPVWTAVFSADGRYIATLSADQTTHVWLWQPEDLIAEACARLTRDLTPEEWRQYVGNEPFRKTRALIPARSPRVGQRDGGAEHDIPEM